MGDRHPRREGEHSRVDIEITWMPYPHHKRFEMMVFGWPRSQDQRFYATETSMPECRWCSRTFEPRRRETGGSPQRYCSRVCREAFHAALHH